jgi:hypothetical protein
VGYNAAEIFLIFELKYFHENKFFSKMFLTLESGAQEDQFDGKKLRPKISWYYPFNTWALECVHRVPGYCLLSLSRMREDLVEVARENA